MCSLYDMVRNWDSHSFSRKGQAHVEGCSDMILSTI